MTIQLKKSKNILLGAVPIACSYGFTIANESIALIYLARYSSDAFAAIFPGFVVYYNTLMLPIGIVKYIRILIASELGKNAPEKSGPLLWLGLPISLSFASLFALLAWQAPGIFRLIGHPPQLQALEVSYFQVMCASVFFQLGVAAFESFYLAIGRRRTILVVEVIGVLTAAVVTPLLIFGVAGLPECGIKGAAYGSLVSAALMFSIYSVLSKVDPRLRPYDLLSARMFTRQQLFTLLRLGVPSGIERSFEELTWTILLLVIGRFGVFALALSNVAINILELAYFPMIALGEVLSVEIAKTQESGDTRQATDLINSTLMAVLIYGVIWTLLLTFGAQSIRGFYFSGLDVSGVTAIETVFFNYFAILCCCILFGSFYYVFNSILMALGDTSFPMMAMLVSFAVVFCVPLYVGLIEYGLGVLWGWMFFLINVSLLALVNGIRYFRVRTDRVAQAM